MTLKDNQLQTFYWSGKNQAGEYIHDEIFARNKQEAIQSLTQKNIKILKIKPINPSLFLRKHTHVSSQDISLITRQLATMLTAGLPLSTALSLIENHQKKPGSRLIVASIKHLVEEGNTLSSAMKNSSNLFDEIYINLISCAELSGQLAETLERIVSYREKAAQQKSKVVKAMLYPLFVTLIAVIITYLMLTSVIPEFEQMFLNFNAQLPWFTQKIISYSQWIKANTNGILVYLAVTIIVIRVCLTKSAKCRFVVDKTMVFVPIVGQIVTKAIIARFSRTVAVSVRSGVPIVSALKTSPNLTSNCYFKKAFEQLYNDTSTGMPVYIALKNSRCFPDLMTQMIMVGEESGTLDKMLDRVADTFDLMLDETLDKMSILIEPLLIVMLGIIVGSLVIAIYLPIFNMMNILG